MNNICDFNKLVDDKKIKGFEKISNKITIAFLNKLEEKKFLEENGWSSDSFFVRRDLLSRCLFA